ncbi:DUF7139 domain-containing protein [Halococcoides cellulosivorans]|uniref:Cell division protein A N-terminal domain-containing protein n=1 Tax=Halococcoides cellulosivorans TaxID=1679096 RepID=A0A2R4WXR9_9EURY|nr:hypothetical protein [Halococcoides cellulosivorans]AWB26334.1 hypothetical protein HARCEL1_00655 [Halococcoides cellulosivorans]
MPSLDAAYSSARLDRDPGRIALGAAACLIGTVAIAVAVLAVVTPVGSFVFGSETQARLIAGVGGGFGLPVVFAGLVAVLPSDRAERIGVALGAGGCLGGVALFWGTYPGGWGVGGQWAFPTLVVYFLGSTLAFLAVLWTLATYRVRNRPGGAIALDVQRPGETHTVQVSAAEFRRYRELIAAGEDGRVLDDLGLREE